MTHHPGIYAMTHHHLLYDSPPWNIYAMLIYAILYILQTAVVLREREIELVIRNKITPHPIQKQL